MSTLAHQAHSCEEPDLPSTASKPKESQRPCCSLVRSIDGYRDIMALAEIVREYHSAPVVA